MANLINKKDSLNTGREKINKSIQDAEEAKNISSNAESTANQALDNSESTQTQLDTIVIEGDSSVESAQARVDTVGNSHTTLKERLDTEHEEVTSQLAQTETELETVKTVKMDKGASISGHQIDKNTIKFDQTWMTEDFIGQFVENTQPINAIPKRDSITRDRVAEKAIEAENLSFVTTSNNLININNLIENKSLSTGGNIIDNSYHDVTEYIYVRPNQNIVFRDINRWALYDEAKNPIMSDTTDTLTTTSDTFFIVISVPKTRKETAQMNYGDTLMPYDGYKVELRRDNKNGLILSPSQKTVREDSLIENAVTPFAIKNMKTPNNLYNKNNIVMDKILNDDGELEDNTSWVTVRNYIEVEPNEVLSLSSDALVRFVVYDIDKKPYLRADRGEGRTEFNVPEWGHYIRVSVGKSAMNSLMLNKGNTLLPYEDHVFQLESTNEYPLILSDELNTIDSGLTPFRSWSYERTDYQEVVDNLSDTGCEVTLEAQDSAGNDIYSLAYGDIENKPVIFTNGNPHGMEWFALHYPIDFMTRIANDDFYDQSLLSELKNNFAFYTIVSNNPWGYINDNYENANGVNLNRNYDKNWEDFPSGEGTIQYKGPHPFSEVETQLIRDKVLELEPYMFIDCHASDGKGGINIGTKSYNENLLKVYNDLFNIFDDAGLPIQEWNLGGSPTANGWVQEQNNSFGNEIITTTVEQPMQFQGNYALTAMFALVSMANEHYKNNVLNQ